MPPVAETVRMPLYIPGPSKVAFAAMKIVAGSVPLIGENVNHCPPVVGVNLMAKGNVPPLVAMGMLWMAEVVPGCVAKTMGLVPTRMRCALAVPQSPARTSTHSKSVGLEGR